MSPNMSPNKQTVDAYMTAFRSLDQEAVLALLTDDVEWFLPNAFHLRGKAEFRTEIGNDNFTGLPDIVTTRMTEENDVVIAEGTVRTQLKSGEAVFLAFCDVFEMRDAKIRKLISYLMPLPLPPS